MDNIVIDKEKTLKWGFAIILLSLISLICTAGSFIYETSHCHYLISNTSLSRATSGLISSLLIPITVCLFIFYIAKFYSNPKPFATIPIIFGILALQIVFFGFTFSEYIWDIYVGIYKGVIVYTTLIKMLLPTLAIFITSILAAISVLKGFNKKLFVIIAVFVRLLCEILFSTFLTFSYPTAEHPNLYVLYTYAKPIGANVFYVTLILFAIKNNIRSNVSLSPKKIKRKIENMTPKQALMFLKEKFELGMINEEEYQAQRAEIIKKL